MEDEDNSAKSLRKFLESDDAAMIQMGLSMAKGSGITEDLLGLVAGLYMWHEDQTVRAAAKSTFTKHAPDELKQILKDNWEVRYRTLKDEDALNPKVYRIFEKFTGTELHGIDIWSRPFTRNHGPITVFIALIEKFDTEEELKNALRKNRLPLSGSKAELRERLEKAGITTAPPIIIKALEFWTKEDASYVYYIHRFMQALGRFEDKRAIRPIIEALSKHTSINNIETAAEVLKEFGEPAIDECIHTLQNSDADARVGAAGVLGIIGGEKAIAPLTDALEDTTVEIRTIAAESLGKIGGAQDSGPIIKLLKDSDSNVRYTAAESLGKSGDKNAVEPLIKLLKVNTYHENDNWEDVRSAAAKALGQIGDLRMKEPLIEMIKGINKAQKLKTDEDDDTYWEDESARREGIGALLECDIKEEKDIETIIRGYNHFYGLSNCHDNEFLELVSKFTKWFTEMDPKYLEILFTEANAMGKSTDYGEYGVVTKKEEDDYYDIWGCSRDNFPKIIQEFGEGAIDPLIEILENKNYHYYLHQIAAEELGKFGDPRASESLTKAYESYSSHYPASYVHDAAEKALKNIKIEKVTSSKGKAITVSKLIEIWNGKLGGKKSVEKKIKVKVKPVSEFNFESSSTPGKFYTVTVEGGYYDCTCPGFMYRKRCSHLDKAKHQERVETVNEEEIVKDDFEVSEVDDEEMPVIFGMYLFGGSNTIRDRAKRIFEYKYTKSITAFLNENFLTEKMELGNESKLYGLGFWNDNTCLDWSGLVPGRGKCRICESSTHSGVKFMMKKSGMYGGSSWSENYCTSCYSIFEKSSEPYKFVVNWWRTNFENIISSGRIQKASVRRELEAKQKEGLSKEMGTNEIIEMLKKSDPLIVFDGLRISENNPNDKNILSHIIPLFLWDEEEIVRTKAEEIIAKNLPTETMVKFTEKIKSANLGPRQSTPDYEVFNVSKLKNILKQINLPVSGRKGDLVQRITENNQKNVGEIPEIIEELTQELKNSEIEIGPFILSVLKYIKTDDSDFGNKTVDILNKYSDKAETYESEVFSLGWGTKVDDYPVNSYKSCLRSLAQKENATKDMIKYIRKKNVDLDDVHIILQNIGPLSKNDLSAIEKYLSKYSADKDKISEIWKLAKNILIKNEYSEMEILTKSIESIDNSGYPSPQCIESTKRLGEIKSKESLNLIIKLLEKVQTNKLNPKECKYGLSALNNLKELGTGKTKTKIVELVNNLLDKAAEKEDYLGSSNYDKGETDTTISNIADIINYYKSETSAEALIKGLTMPYFWNYDSKFASDSDNGTLRSGQKILDALRNIANAQSKDSLIVALKQLEMKTGDKASGNSWAPEKIIFATLLSITDDVKRLQFFVDHWEKHENKNFRMNEDVKKLYEIALKDNTGDNIARLIKELVGKNHTLYKNYFSNIGGKDDPRKFLMSDDPGMQLMGISLAKGLKYPEDIRPIIVSLSLFSNEENIRKKALECVKEIGIDKITMPNEKDWNEEMNTRYFPGWYGNKKRIDPKPLIESLISLGSIKSLTNLKDIFKRISGYDKNLELIVKGITEFCNGNESLKFYDELIEAGMGRYGSRIGRASHWGYNINEDTRQRLVLVLSAYVEINAQGRHGIIFSKTFDELVRAITDKATTEEKQGPLRGFIKEGMGLCLKLDKNALRGDSEKTLLTLQKHLFSNSREEKIAAAQIFEILYKSRRSRKRISEIVEPARKDRLTLVRTSLKSIK